MKSTPLALETLFIALLSALVLTGCASHRPLQVAEHVTRDTVYINKLHYDSIYIDNRQKVYLQSDTVYHDRTKYEYRYRLLRDTVYKTQIDSIPYEARVVETQEIARPLTFFDRLCRACFYLLLGALLVLFLMFLFKLKTRIRL